MRTSGHSFQWTVFSFTHIEGITLGAGVEVDEVAGGAGGMGVDGIGEVGDRASAAGVYGAGFTVGLWQGNESGLGRGGRGTRLVLTRS